jgi:DNA-binding beta-propeller fold protein YncE
MMNWKVKKIINYDSGGTWEDGYASFGFYDSKGNLYAMSYLEHWVGCCSDNGRLKWSAGNNPVINSDYHLTLDLHNPHYITDTPDGMLLISSNGNKKIYKVNPVGMTSFLLIDGDSIGLTDVGNCVFDSEGNMWVNEIQGCRIWQFTLDGIPIQTLGDGKPGFQTEDCSFKDVRFNWIYDIRNGPDGNIYVLDSKNYAVRMVDVKSKTVKTIAGTGTCGYSGDGGNALNATFGGNPDEYFDGPWSLSLDEEGNIYVGDTQNHVVRMIERSTNNITTIAGNPDIKKGIRNCPTEEKPLSLNLPKICSMDYYNGCLYIPEWDGDLIVLSKW